LHLDWHFFGIAITEIGSQERQADRRSFERDGSSEPAFQAARLSRVEGRDERIIPSVDRRRPAGISQLSRENHPLRLGPSFALSPGRA
jgi:hypothetical protein